MFSITFFLCISLTLMFTEAYNYNSPFSNNYGDRFNVVQRNIVDLEAKRQYMMNRFPLLPPSPRMTQPIIRPRFQFPVQLTAESLQPPMSNNDFKEPLLLLVMSAYSRLLALTQLAMQSMTNPSIPDPQTSQSLTDEKATADETQTEKNESSNLKNKPSQNDEEQENPSSKESNENEELLNEHA